MAEYAHPDVLVSTDWAAEHRGDSNVRIVESDEDVLLYDIGHVPGSVKVDWHTELNDPVVRDYVDKEGFEELMSKKGISNDTSVVFYGDRNNWWACYAFWVFKLFGHEKCLVMNGGRQKWIDEERELTRDVPSYPATSYTAKDADYSIRAFREEVLGYTANNPLVDVRSPKEYTGELIHMEDYPQEGALRGGHIPGATNIPWARAANEDQTFKSADELLAIYRDENNVKSDDDVLVYCRIGERSSHTWFVLTYLLGYPSVRNYDGSWTEWGNLVKVPIEKP